MNEKSTYFNREGEERFVDIFRKNDIKNGEFFQRHWHEHLQIYYFINGTATIECANNSFQAHPESIVIVNSNELHYLESLSDDLDFYTIRVAPTFLFSSQIDVLQAIYLAPISLNRIVFENYISEDKELIACILKLLNEYANKDLGYELVIKGTIYILIVELLRNHMKQIYSENELKEKLRTLERFNIIFEFMDKNYSEKITLKELSSIVHLSVHHFCRTFKQLTGKTSTDYLNTIRMNKAVHFLKETNDTITEIAIKCGFDNINYFSRLFKKQYAVSPTKYRSMFRDSL